MQVRDSNMENNFLYNIAIIDQQTQDARAQLPFNSYQDLTFLKAHVSVERHIVYAAMQKHIIVRNERRKFCLRSEGIRGVYASAKQKFPRKTGTAAVRDHVITTRRADAAEPSRCRRTRRG
jgi:hypothetical protein